MNRMKLLALLVVATVTATTAMAMHSAGPTIIERANQATPAPTGTPYALSGRLGAYVQVADACSYYPLIDCAGHEIQVSEQTMDQLRPFVGSDVRLTVVTAECGRSIAGQPLYGPVAISVQAGVPCATGTVTVETTATPATTATMSVETTSTPATTATMTVEATSTPATTATMTVEATSTPATTATMTVEATATPATTATVTVQATPTPTATVTVQSTATPMATMTAQPTATAVPTGTPYALSGRLGAYVQVADGCSHYPLTECSGNVIEVSEQTLNQLRPFVGSNVRVTVVTAECGRGIAGQALYGPVAISVQAGVPCPATPVPGEPTPPAPQVCPSIQNRVPAAAINAALANPEMVSGWNQRCNPSVPRSPSNSVRSWLTLQRLGVPYHPTYNPLVFKCGCP